MDRQKRKNPERIVIFIYIAVIFLILLIAVVFSVGHEKGYRIKGFAIQKTSNLILEVSEPQTWVFIEDNPVHQTLSDSEIINIPDVELGRKLITVIKNGYFPWAKYIDIPSNKELTIYPFLLKQHVKASQILVGDPDFLKVYQTFNTFTPQTNYQAGSHQILATEKGVEIKCLETECQIPLIETTSPILNVYQFRNNPNVVIYGTPTEIQVSELVDDLRISYKIFEGQDVNFFSEEDTLFVKSAGQYFKISL